MSSANFCPNRAIWRLRLLPAAVALTFASTTVSPSPIVDVAELARVAVSSNTVLVQSCADDGNPLSLRHLLTAASDGDTLDLSSLACSTITLQQGQLGTSRSLTIIGPDAGVTIDAHHDSRVFAFSSTGQVTLKHLTIENGTASTTTGGGCIYSNGSVYLQDANVHDCTSQPPSYFVARGGAVFAKKTVGLAYSKVTQSSAIAQPGSRAEGGGIWAALLFTNTAEISQNIAQSDDQNPSVGGGVFTTYRSVVSYSTMSHNRATRGGGVYSGYGVEFVDSTISYNVARTGGAAYLANSGRSTTRFYSANSTVASNYADSAANVGGVFVSEGYLSIYSSIVANSLVTGNATLASQDVGYGYPTAIFGDHNIITRPSVAGMKNTIAADPLLGPLQNNGGDTPSRLILAGSPAFKHGIDIGNGNFDQRHILRPPLGLVDIGAIQDTIWANTFEPLGEEGHAPPH